MPLCLRYMLSDSREIRIGALVPGCLSWLSLSKVHSKHSLRDPKRNWLAFKWECLSWSHFLIFTINVIRLQKLHVRIFYDVFYIMYLGIDLKTLILIIPVSRLFLVCVKHLYLCVMTGHSLCHGRSQTLSHTDPISLKPILLEMCLANSPESILNAVTYSAAPVTGADWWSWGLWDLFHEGLHEIPDVNRVILCITMVWLNMWPHT